MKITATLKKLCFTFACVFIATIGFAQQQGFDPSFGNGGIVFNPYMGIAQWTDVAIQSDGKILTVGWDSINKIVRFNTNGSPDNSFGTGGFISLPPRSSFTPKKITILPDSSIFVCGTSYQYISFPGYWDWNFACIKYRKTGVLDSSFGNIGFVQTDLTNPAFPTPNQDENFSMAFQVDGKFILCGDDRNDTIEMVRYLPQGTVDSSFGINGIVKTYGGMYETACYAIAIQANGRILLGGRFSGGGPLTALVLRYNAEGSPDTSFNHTGRWVWLMGGNEVSNIKLQPDGKILIATGISYAPQMPSGAEVIVRLQEDGSFDTSFNHLGYLPIARPDFWPVQGEWGGKMALLPNGDIVLGGTLGDTLQYSNNKYCSLSRCTKDGVPDSSFGVNGKQVMTVGPYGSTWLYGLAVQPDGKIVTAGSNSNFGTSLGGGALARFMPNGGTEVSEILPLQKNITVYPNPCHETLYLSGYDEKTAGKIQQIQIINSLGQVIYNDSAPGTPGPVSCTPFPNGVYSLIVRGLYGSFTSKFIKK